MALFSSPKKESNNSQGPQKQNIPVNEVTAMKQQGLSNSQVIQSLQRMGYKSYQIFDAMNQADMRLASPQGPNAQSSNEFQQMQGQNQNPSQENIEMPEIRVPRQQGPYQQNMPNSQYQQAAYPPDSQMPQESAFDPDIEPVSAESTEYSYEDYHPEPISLDEQTEKIEEIAEAIIDEKWDDLIRNINKVAEWKERAENRITAIEQQIKFLKDSFDNLQKAVVGKVTEYDQNLINVGTEIKAMERVFQKILPGLSDNISELSRLTDNIKKSDPNKTKIRPG